MSNEAISVEVKSDGVYLTIDKTLSTKEFPIAYVIALLESYKIREIDSEAVSKLLKSDESTVAGKISSDTNVTIHPETVKVDVSRDRTKAYLIFKPAQNGGRRATMDDVNEALSEATIKEGIFKENIEQALKERDPREKYLIAEGKLPIHEKDGYLEYFFNAEKKTGKPKLLEDGTVDFRNLDLIETVEAQAVLIKVHPPLPGTNGIDVLGQPLEHKKAKPAPAILRGKGVSVDSTGRIFTSDTCGQVIFQNKKLSVSSVLEIESDIDNSTGNIEFNGSVVISGMVRTGFSVIATGNIEVQGIVEGANIKSDADVFLYKGIQGRDSAVITAGGDINAKYAYHCVLNCGGDIISDSIMHSNVECNGSITLLGKNGLLVGGKILVRDKIEAKTIGSTMATNTEIQVGNEPKAIDEYKELVQQLNASKVEYEKVTKAIGTLVNLSKSTPLNADKKNLLLKAIHTKSFLRDKLASCQARLDVLLPSLSQNTGVIIAYSIIHSGVKAQIGNSIMYVQDDIRKCTLKNKDGKVVIGVAPDL